MVNRYKTALPKLILGTLLLIATVGFVSIDERFIIELSNRLSSFNDARPTEKIYLQMDREVYQPGDDLWFKGYILDAISFRPIERSKTLFVTVLDDEGSLVSQDKFIIKNGYSAGDLTLPEVMDDGNYQITAYTSWMKNYDDPQVFSKSVRVKKLAPVEMIMPKVTLDLSFSDSIYYPGQEVAIKVVTSTTERAETKELQYEFSIKADGEEMHSGGGYGLNNGSFYIRYTLPENQEASSFTAEISSLYEDQTIAVDAMIPVDVPSINIDFFPEGGKAIRGVSSRMAFRATDKFGNPVSISGRIESSSGQKVAEVSTRHRGMGDFNFFPKDSLYYLVVTSPEIKENRFPIRDIAASGLNMSIVGQSDQVLNVRVSSSDTKRKERVFLTAMVRNQIYWSLSGNLKDEAFVTIPSSNLPTGIVQITLFDTNGIPQAERLAFVNEKRKLNVELITDKATYGPREKVRAKIRVTDPEGQPVTANLSMTAYDNMYSFLSRNKGTDIFSHLYLDSEIPGGLPNVSDYFDESEDAQATLDLMLMTNGWRKFDFTQILSDSVKYQKAISRDYFEGQVVNNWGKPVEGAKVSIVQSGTYQSFDVNSGLNGSFYFDKTNLDHNPSEVLFSALSKRGKQNVKIELKEYLDDQFIPQYLESHPLKDAEQVSEDRIRFNSIYYTGDRLSFLKDLGDYKLLQEILIEEKRILPEKVDDVVKEFKNFSTDSKSGEELRNSDDFLGILRQVTNVPSVDFSNGNVYFRSLRGQSASVGGFTMTRVDDATGAAEQVGQTTRDNFDESNGVLFILNGTPMGHDYNRLNYLRPEMIEFVTVMKGSRAATVYGGRAQAGVVFVTTKKELENMRENEEAHFTIVNNFSFPRVFEGRKYETEMDIINVEPDLRNTLHWEPEIILDENGEAFVEFYNSDRNTWVNLKIEGVSTTGLVGTGVGGYRIDKSARANSATDKQ